MQFKDAIEGQRINVYCMTDYAGYFKLVAYNGVAGTVKIPATVLSKTGNAVRLGWKNGERHPDMTANNVLVVLSIDELSKGFVIGFEYGSHCECEPYQETNGLPIPAKKNYGNECPCGVHPSVCIYHRS